MLALNLQPQTQGIVDGLLTLLRVGDAPGRESALAVSPLNPNP